MKLTIQTSRIDPSGQIIVHSDTNINGTLYNADTASFTEYYPNGTITSNWQKNYAYSNGTKVSAVIFS